MKAIDLSNPQPGYYKTRLVKGGPWVPAVIYRRCPFVLPSDELDGRPAAPDEWFIAMDRPWVTALQARVCDWSVDPFELITRRLEPIDLPTYQYLLELRAWALRQDNPPPEATPTQRVNLSAMTALF